MKSPWMKFYPTDWRSDPRLRMCSLEARGLWIELVCLMHEAQPYGHLRIGGEIPSLGQIASMVGAHHKTVDKALIELLKHGVFDRNTEGVIVSRRMVRDQEKANKDKENGKKGGNPGLTPTPPFKDKAQNPEARVQKEKKDSSSSRKAKTEVDYTEEFETKVWQPYPRKKGTSKFKAFQLWRMLTEDRQQRIIATIPLFAQQMKLEGREESVIKHLERFISHKVYETFAVTSESNVVVALEWHKTATREQWVRALKIYEMDSNWRTAWGPKPGYPGCSVPQDLVAALPYHLNPENDPHLRSQNVAGSKKGPEAV